MRKQQPKECQFYPLGVIIFRVLFLCTYNLLFTIFTKQYEKNNCLVPKSVDTNYMLNCD